MENSDPTGPSVALSSLPEDLRLEHDLLLNRNREELVGIDGLTSVHDMLVERFTFVYVYLRHLERDFLNLDAQRYNQLTTLWIKIGSDLLERYEKIYEAGAINELFAKKVMEIVSTEVDDPVVLGRIRARLETADADIGQKR